MRPIISGGLSMDSAVPVPNKCGECDEEINIHTLVTITCIGSKLDYVVPCFLVFEARLRYIWEDDESGTVYDGFFREEGSLTVHSTIRLCNGHRNVFFIPVEEFNKTVDVGENQLVAFEGEYFVVWRWSESECKRDDEDDHPQSSTDSVDYESVEETEETIKSTCADSEVKHCFVFYQEVLSEALLKRTGKEPDV